MRQNVVYAGSALDDAVSISRIVHYGQMAVTESVWTRVQANLPNLTQVRLPAPCASRYAGARGRTQGHDVYPLGRKPCRLGGALRSTTA